MPTSRTRIARKLRRDMTDAERLLWQQLRKQQTGFKFRRQFPLGPYILDFVSLDVRLCLEIDGGQHAGNRDDVARDHFVQSQGFKVLRFWNKEVLGNIEGVMQIIGMHLPPPNLPRQAGEERRPCCSSLPTPPNRPVAGEHARPVPAGKSQTVGFSLPASTPRQAGEEKSPQFPSHPMQTDVEQAPRFPPRLPGRAREG